MCSPTVIQSALAGLDRREAFCVAAGMLAGAKTPTSCRADSARPTAKRTIAASKVLDLTHVLSPAFPIWPGNVPIKVSNVAKVVKDGYYANKWELVEHHGTHLDAPAHFAAPDWDDRRSRLGGRHRSSSPRRSSIFANGRARTLILW